MVSPRDLRLDVPKSGIKRGGSAFITPKKEEAPATAYTRCQSEVQLHSWEISSHSSFESIHDALIG